MKTRLGHGLGVVLAVCSQGCAQQNFSKPVRDVYDVRCPASKIRVLEHEQQNGEQRWVLDACGVPLELEQGLEMPVYWRELVSDPRELEGLRARLAISTLGIDEAARDKAEAWCKLGPPGNPAEIAFYATNEAELAECRRSMRGLVTLGRERQAKAALDEDRPKFEDPTKEPPGPETHWFSLGQWLFIAPLTFHRPACSRLRVMNPPECYCPVGSSPSSPCAAAERERQARADGLKLQKRVVVANERGRARGAGEVEPRSVYYLRGGIGVGYLSSAGGEMRSQRGGSGTVLINLGAMATRALAVGASVQTYRAFNDYHATALNGDSLDVPLDMLSIQGFASYYFLVGPVSFHLDALAGLAHLKRAYDTPARSLDASIESSGTGPALGLGAGVESHGSGLMIGLRIAATQAWTRDAGARFSTFAPTLTLDLGYY